MLGLAFAGIIAWELLQNAQGGSQTGFWMLALPPIMFLICRAWKLTGYKAVVSAAAFVSTAALVIPVRGIPVPQSEFDKPINLLSHRALQSVALNIDRDYRVDFRDKAFSNRLWAMNTSYYGLKSFYNQLTPQPFDQFRFSNLTNVPHLCEMMGARYVLCGSNNSPLDPNAKQILETEGYRLYENSSLMPRLTVVHRVAGVAKNEAEFINIIRKGFDYLSTAYVMAPEFKTVTRFLGNPPRLAQAGDRIVKIVDQPNRIHSTVVSASPSLLVLNEWFTTAWKVRVNGKKQPVLRINQWQTGVLLRAGKNRVEFKYRPTLFRVLMILNRITLALLVSVLIFFCTEIAWLQLVNPWYFVMNRPSRFLRQQPGSPELETFFSYRWRCVRFGRCPINLFWSHDGRRRRWCGVSLRSPLRVCSHWYAFGRGVMPRLALGIASTRPSFSY